MNTKNDIVIIGSGPAGLSAALYTCRAGLSTAVIGLGIGALEKADKIENYFGLEAVISGPELIEVGKKQVTRLGATLYEEAVVGMTWEPDGFLVETTARKIEATAVIIATGAPRNKLRIKGLAEYEGRGVSYCAVCDAFFYRGKNVGVLGSGEYAAHEIAELLPTAASVTLFTNGAKTTTAFPETVTIDPRPIAEIIGEQRLEGLHFTDGSKLSVDGLFVAAGNAGAGELAKKLAVGLKGNSILVDEKMATDLPGLFAAGDCVGGTLQISVAVGEGARAGLSAIEYIRAQKRTKVQA